MSVKQVPCWRSLTQSAAIALLEDTTQILTMKHSDWLRLKLDSVAVASLRASGDRICATMRQYGYLCRKQTQRLSWKLSKEGQDDYVLTFAPAPVSHWNLIPKNTSPERQQLWQLIERTLTTIRGELMKTPQERNLQVEDYSRPWAITRLLKEDNLSARRSFVANASLSPDAAVEKCRGLPTPKMLNSRTATTPMEFNYL